MHPPEGTQSGETGQRPQPVRWGAWCLMVVAAVALLTAMAAGPAGAQESEESERRWDSEWCLGCHNESTSTVEFVSGEDLSVGVDGDAFLSARHAEFGVQCVHCHTAIVDFPHEEPTAANAHDYRTQLSTSCSVCHWREYTVSLDEAHALVDLEHRDSTPVCIDCHEPHAPRALAVSHPEMQATCGECHTDQEWGDIEAIHVLDPTRVEQADAPPLILFYGIIAGGVVLLIGVAWAAVGLVQWARRRPAGQHP